MNMTLDYITRRPVLSSDLAKLKRELRNTPKWRKIKRLRLFEAIQELKDDMDLLDHVLLED